MKDEEKVALLNFADLKKFNKIDIKDLLSRI
jgi:hypothetical protein